jgi:hypothetical protein
MALSSGAGGPCCELNKITITEIFPEVYNGICPIAHADAPAVMRIRHTLRQQVPGVGSSWQPPLGLVGGERNL